MELEYLKELLQKEEQIILAQDARMEYVEKNCPNNFKTIIDVADRISYHDGRVDLLRDLINFTSSKIDDGQETNRKGIYQHEEVDSRQQ